MHDDEYAFFSFLRTAELENAGSMYNLGHMYANGCGTEKDTSESLKWFRLSAEKGNSKVYLRLGLIYLNGISTGKIILNLLSIFVMQPSKGM